MHEKFASILCCPKTGENFNLIIKEYYPNGLIKEGWLKSVISNITYPIINGIPRFVGKEHYTGTFGFEWQKWPKIQFEEENKGKPMEGHTKKMFTAITRLEPNNIHNYVIIEFGCGPGRFLDLIRRWGGIAVGMDMSMAVESAHKNFETDPDVLIVQGDILNPPFKEESFDCGYTIGVLHHTPNPALGLKNLAKTVKTNGTIACCVYSKQGFYNYPSVLIFRKFFLYLGRGLGKKFSNKIAALYAFFAANYLYQIMQFISRIPFLGDKIRNVFEKYLLVILYLPDKEWRYLDIFDAITPYYASTHTPQEIIKWFQDAQCANITQTSWGDTAFIATKL